MITRNKGRMHSGINALLILLGNGQQLDYITQFPAIIDVFRFNFCNSFNRNIFKGHPGAKSDGSQNCNFTGRIPAAYIGGRIGFRIAFCLGLRQNSIEIDTLGRHLVQHIIRCSVNYSHHFADTIRSQTAL